MCSRPWSWSLPHASSSIHSTSTVCGASDLRGAAEGIQEVLSLNRSNSKRKDRKEGQGGFMLISISNFLSHPSPSSLRSCVAQWTNSCDWSGPVDNRTYFLLSYALVGHIKQPTMLSTRKAGVNPKNLNIPVESVYRAQLQVTSFFSSFHKSSRGGGQQ